MDRRSLLDGGGTPTRENLNVFDDEFEVEEEGYVADGFRGRDGDGSRQEYRDEEPMPSAPAHFASPSVTPAGPSRNSTRKSRGQQNPFASPEDDGTEMPLVRTPSGNFDIARRSVSSASSHQFARTSSQRFGAGPSHPYAMYTQGTVARTPSVATTSTIRPQRRSSTRGPQHPYAMYTQGVGDDLDDDSHETAQNLVPVGFLGAGENYQRRRGPDGEEIDLLGDFGHTEQLPPYTRYPEDGPEKMPLLGVPNPPGPLHSRAPVLGTDPGMELMHAQLQTAAPQSMTDQSELNRQPSIASRRSMAPSMQASSQDDSLTTLKTWSEKSWTEKRKTRVCGVPCWWFIVFVGVVVFIGAMLGGVIGGFVQGQKKGQAQALAAAAKTSLYDASMVVTSTTTNPPATGTFALALGTPQATQAACLTIPGQEPAWTCDLAGDAEIQIVIDTPIGSDQPGAYLQVEVDSDDTIAYGSQRSSMVTNFSPFLLVIDNDAKEDGVAYYFQQQYNKLALIPEDAINQTTGKFKRDHPHVASEWLTRKQYASPGEKPWLCYWNNTFIEGFIYPDKMAVIAPTTITHYPTPSPTSAPWPRSSSSGYGRYRSYSSSDKPHTTPWRITGVAPSKTVTTTVTMPSTTCTYSGAASDFPIWMANNYPGWYEQDGKAWPPDGPDRAKRDYSYYGEYNRYDDKDPSQYPYLVKIEERRVPNSPHPYCNQITILENLQWGSSDDANGQQINIALTEQDPPYQRYINNGDVGKKARLRKRGVVPGECHCQWQSGE